LIIGSIVDHNQLKVLIRLFRKGFYQFEDMLPFILAGDYDGNQWVFYKELLSSNLPFIVAVFSS